MADDVGVRRAVGHAVTRSGCCRPDQGRDDRIVYDVTVPVPLRLPAA